MQKDANGIDRQVIEKNAIVLSEQTKEIAKNATEKQVTSSAGRTPPFPRVSSPDTLRKQKIEQFLFVIN